MLPKSRIGRSQAEVISRPGEHRFEQSNVVRTSAGLSERPPDHRLREHQAGAKAEILRDLRRTNSERVSSLSCPHKGGILLSGTGSPSAFTRARDEYRAHEDSPGVLLGMRECL